ncbi:MAG: aminotransferase class I/II-fold pyridoxal phosphate-dependent enzyme [Cohaesibacter sp.]|nr:aminotransferase class I/II-fold pyridoxal phosphate-dependent enzyme [Cohaesibacter sp.]
MGQATQGTYQAGLSAAEVANLAGDHPITKLSSNENPFGPSPKAIEAAQQTLAQTNFYPERDDKKIREALAAFHGNGLSEENFFSANSGVETLALIEEALINPNERAIICPPCFGAYRSSLGNRNALIDMVPLKGDQYEVDVEGLLSAITKDTRLVYLCNPNNPTGTFFGQDILDAVLNALPDHVTLIYDEVYYQFATEFDLPDAQKYVREGRNIVIVHSFSKAYGLAGMRIGYGIGPIDIIKKIRSKKRSFHVNSVSMAAALAAINDKDHLSQTVDNNTVERARLSQALKELGLKTAPSQSNFVMFQCPDTLLAKELTAKLVALGVMVRPAFDLPTHIRATIGKPNENDRLLAALSDILK